MTTAEAIWAFAIVVLVLGITAVAFAFKQMAIAIVAGLAWAGIGAALFTANAAGLLPLAGWVLGWVCLLMAIMMLLSAAFLRKRDIPDKPIDKRELDEVIDKEALEARKERAEMKREARGDYD